MPAQLPFYPPAQRCRLFRAAGYSYLVTIGVSSIIMQLIALVVNNIDPRRRYPTYYW